MATTFRELLAADKAYLAPAVFDPLTAKLAEQAALHATIGFDRLIAIEKATVEK